MSPNHIHLIRHAQGFHNLSIESHNIRDPLLTPLGEQQCVVLSNNISTIQSIDCIVASPMRRAIYTALITFRDVLKANPSMKIIALPELQETSSMPCDIGLGLDELRTEFKGLPVDLSQVSEDYINKVSGDFAPRSDLVSRRAQRAREFLHGRQEKEVAAVAHGGMLHFLTEDWAGSMAGCGTGWANCELRTYTFTQPQRKTINHTTLVETNTSMSRRIHNQPLTPDEQIQLQIVTQRAWAKDGYIVLTDATIAQDTASYSNAESSTTSSGIDPAIEPAAVKSETIACKRIQSVL